MAIAAVCLLSCLSTAATAQSISFDRLSLEEGLSQSNIFSFTQDSAGYLWMGTESAADRFDGHQIEAFRHDPADDNTITAGAVVDLHSPPDDQLWILTEDGVSHLDLATEIVTRAFEVEATTNDPIFGTIGGLETFCEDHVIAVFSEQAWRVDGDTHKSQRLSFNGQQPKDRLTQPIRDNNGHVWLTDGHDLWRSNCETDTLDHKATWPDATGLPEFGVSLLALTGLGDLAWAGADGIGIIDTDTDQWRHTIRLEREVSAVATDALGGLWVLTDQALIRAELDETGESVRRWTTHIEHELPIDNFTNKPALQTAQSGDGIIWVATANLLGAYRPNQGTFQQFAHDPLNPQSPPPTAGWTGYDLFADRFGVVWIGAKLGGVARYVPQRHRFEHFRDISQPSYVVRGVAEQRVDNKRFVWVGLDDRGLQLFQNHVEHGMTPVSPERIVASQPVDPTRLRIRSFAVHPKTDSVWFNSVEWFGRLDAREPAIRFESQHSEEFDRSRAMAFSPTGRYLYQALGPNLIEHEFDAEGNRLDGQALDWLPSKINEFRIQALTVLASGTVLMSAEDQLFAMRSWDQTVTPVDIASNSHRTRVISMLALSGGRLLLGTANSGLIEAQWSESDNTFSLQIERRWSQSDGLADVTVYAMARDLAGRVWLSSNRGLSRLDLTSNQILNFTLDDGLQAYEFNSHVVHQTRFGHLYFGGINGVNVFEPAQIEPHSSPPLVRLKQARINRAPAPSEGLARLNHFQNSWVFEFVGLHSVSPTKNRYAYRLEGLDQDWVQSGTERVARYTGLDPGEYRFWVRSANSDGVWSEPNLLFEARIQPPPWLSPMAYVAYGLLSLVLVVVILSRARARRLELQRLVAQRTQELKHKNELVVEQSSALQDALNARTLFFANISHELRTPLTLIEANLSDIENQLSDPSSVSTARRYLKRMVHMVDQLLDLSRIRIQGVQTEAQPWSLNELVETTHSAYQGVAAAKRINLTHHMSSQWMTRIDAASAEKILLNLLTNAIKFTPTGGQVSIELTPDDESGVWLRIRDTGPGIPVSDQASIFERFHRVPIEETKQESGAGIGLALVSEAVAAVGGRIELTSRVGHGSTFSVWLPAERHDSTPIAQRTLPSPDTPNEHADAPQTHDSAANPQRQAGDPIGRLLVVEDNPDLLAYLDKQLSTHWSVIQAHDGLEAIDKLKDHDVDLILSDIMMPNLDGLSLLKRVRDNLSTSHIPFLFLTARGDNETELQSLMLAADDFLRKPFDARILGLKLKNILDNRRRLQAHLGHTPHTEATHSDNASTLSPRDHRFVERLTAYLDAHFDDETLTVAGLADALAVDERTLQRKTNALFGQPPARFINTFRINKACEMLADPGATIQEVAYACGYANPRYFSRVFTTHRGQSPSQWRKNR